MAFILPNPPLYIDRDVAGGGNSPEYTGEALRSSLGGLLSPVNGSAGLARSGALTIDAMRVSSSGIALRVNAGPFVLGTNKGAYITSLNSSITADSIKPADATNARIDRMVLRIDDPANGGLSARSGSIEYLPGTPAANPSMPTPTGATVYADLARVDVPRSGAGSPTVTDLRKFTSANGGVIPIRASTDIDVVTKQDGQLVYDMQTDTLHVYTGTTWKKLLIDSDTGWTNVAVRSPFRNYSSAAPIQVRLKNGVCTFNGAVGADNPSDGATFAILPTQFRPDSQSLNFICQGSGDNRWLLTINTDGTCKVGRYGAGAVGTNTWLPFTATYLVG